MYRLTRLALIALALFVLGSAGAWADDRTGGGSGSMSGPHHRPARPTPRPHPFFGCCLGGGYFPPAPPVVVIPPPPVYVVVPAPGDHLPGQAGALPVTVRPAPTQPRTT